MSESKADPSLHGRTVVFDCDSTLSSLEGIDELAAGDPAVTELTARAMAGDVPLDAVYGERLARVRPGRRELDRLGRRYCDTLVEDAAAVVLALTRAGLDVRIVSGGLLPALLPLARHLGVPAAHVHAVAVELDEEGAFAGYDATTPLARAGGKRLLLERLAGGLLRPAVLVGDGATDLEAAPAVDLFVGYCGVATRPEVEQAAEVVVRCRSLAPVLPLATPASSIDPEDRALYEKGMELLRSPSVSDRRRTEHG